MNLWSSWDSLGAWVGAFNYKSCRHFGALAKWKIRINPAMLRRISSMVLFHSDFPTEPFESKSITEEIRTCAYAKKKTDWTYCLAHFCSNHIFFSRSFSIHFWFHFECEWEKRDIIPHCAYSFSDKHFFRLNFQSECSFHFCQVSNVWAFICRLHREEWSSEDNQTIANREKRNNRICMSNGWLGFASLLVNSNIRHLYKYLQHCNNKSYGRSTFIFV